MSYEIKRSDRLEKVSYAVRGPVLDEAKKLEAQGEQIIKLNIGNPAIFGFHTPERIMKKMAEQLSMSDAYSDSAGILEAREAIVKYHTANGIEGLTVNDVYTGNGCSELITTTMQGLLNRGDEILVPAPDYPLWTAAVALSGGEPVHYICDESSDWMPDIKDMEKKITEKTKAIVVINPNNPTVAVYPQKVLEDIVGLARKHGLIILSDEIYDRLIMDGIKHTSIASLASDVLCITYNGLSKSHRACGYRCGWMVISGPKDGASDFIAGLNVITSMRLCSNVPAQSIVKYALEDKFPDPDFVPGGRLYRQRDYITEALNTIPGMSAVKPRASFYIFPKVDSEQFNIKDDEQFALDLLREKKILIVNGTGFSWPAPDHFRLVYLADIDVLHTVIERLGDFLSGYKQK